MDTSDNGLTDDDFLADGEDLCDIPANPLRRASFCLNWALHLSAGGTEENAGGNEVTSPKEGSDNVDMECHQMCLVSLAYVYLQRNDPAGALEVSSKVLPTASPRLREMADVYSREAAVYVG